jgi:hypothetical protein
LLLVAEVVVVLHQVVVVLVGFFTNLHILLQAALLTQ